MVREHLFLFFLIFVLEITLIFTTAGENRVEINNELICERLSDKYVHSNGNSQFSEGVN